MKQQEIDRLSRMIEFDLSYSTGQVYGIDEVGRGSLAGPVVAGCVCMDPTILIEGVNDSKKLSERKREKVAAEIQEKAVFWAIGEASIDEIEALNIVGATKLAMQRAFSACKGVDFVLMDAIDPSFLSVQGVGLVRADAISYAVAAASIVAKVYRDNLMKKMADQWSVYDFEKNKGYGTAAHIHALQSFGPCPQHRASFIRGIIRG